MGQFTNAEKAREAEHDEMATGRQRLQRLVGDSYL